jgi:hypothetical protein
MNDQDKEHMRILFAGFALAGAIMSRDNWTPEGIWSIADEMVDAKDKQEPEIGIVAVKSRRRK